MTFRQLLSEFIQQNLKLEATEADKLVAGDIGNEIEDIDAEMSPEVEAGARRYLAENKAGLLAKYQQGFEQAKQRYLDDERKRLLKKNRSRGR